MKKIKVAGDLLKIWNDCDEYWHIARSLCLHKAQEICGLPPVLQAAAAASLWQEQQKPAILVTPDEDSAQLLAENLAPLVGEQVQLFPSLDLLPFEVYAQNIEVIAQRIKVLAALSEGQNLLVVTDIVSLSRKVIPAAEFRAHCLEIVKGETLAIDDLPYILNDMGYEREKLVEIPGTFSMRGSLLDIFPMESERPIRLEFFDDEVESLRFFDPDNQRSLATLDTFKLLPARELVLTKEVRQLCLEGVRLDIEKASKTLKGTSQKSLLERLTSFEELLVNQVWDPSLEQLLPYCYPQAGSLLDYLDDALVFFSEPDHSKSNLCTVEAERLSCYSDLLSEGQLWQGFYDNFKGFNQLANDALQQRVVLFSQLTVDTSIPSWQQVQILARAIPVYHHNWQTLKEDFAYFKKQEYQVVISASSGLRLKRIKEILQDLGVPGVNLIQSQLSVGFESPHLKMALITEKELLEQEGKKKYRHFPKEGKKIENFLDLQKGDYVVHISQGIGIYQGVERLKFKDSERDYLHIQYAGDDKLYLPVDQLDFIQKYVGDDSKAPKLYRLGGGDWQRLKNKVRYAVKEMADELLKIYAAREQAQGFAFSADTLWQMEFEDAFPYQETTDQLRALEEIKQDMEGIRPMDRLLCGDVGYGKTELALRAAFKAVSDGKQVAMLVPTTVLAQQHCHTFEQRFTDFPIKVACLSRFQTAREAKEILRQLAAGDLDIVVGTHRLLSSDVVYKDLGLLIVDEEQRFGVTHKEKIKSLKVNVDVLTLSATPIPRTLHMSLVGMRDMSIIATPPPDRHPVQTYVLEYHDRLIKDVIAREISRAGQVYFVHNHVQDIYDVAGRLETMLPEAKILVGHGQMRERELEQVMMSFVNGEADILVSTTIIESGLDIPNVNTLIVDEADCFGLSQLYQLRGRVGRSSRQAFAYFTYRKDRQMTEIAKKRLIAIRDFTELGSGFKIAMRDMEIRGAGNILGPQQHGHIAAVGFDMYCRLLQKEIAAAGGKAVEHEEINPLLELPVKAYIPDQYLEDASLKVEIYKKIASAQSLTDIDDLAEELLDRYGKKPPQLDNLLRLGKLRVMARVLCITSIIQKLRYDNGYYIEIKFADFHPLLGEDFLKVAAKSAGNNFFCE
jgi:transcription-repair coupling factor (superfamily II helicase)